MTDQGAGPRPKEFWCDEMEWTECGQISGVFGNDKFVEEYGRGVDAVLMIEKSAYLALERKLAETKQNYLDSSKAMNEEIAELEAELMRYKDNNEKYVNDIAELKASQHPWALLEKCEKLEAELRFYKEQYG